MTYRQQRCFKFQHAIEDRDRAEWLCLLIESTGSPQLDEGDLFLVTRRPPLIVQQDSLTADNLSSNPSPPLPFVCCSSAVEHCLWEFLHSNSSSLALIRNSKHLGNPLNSISSANPARTYQTDHWHQLTSHRTLLLSSFLRSIPAPRCSLPRLPQVSLAVANETGAHPTTTANPTPGMSPNRDLWRLLGASSESSQDCAATLSWLGVSFSAMSVFCRDNQTVGLDFRVHLSSYTL
ncbi:hypothetical protein BJ875DRAFT_202380 [Amylocarpus encephaloides]|uniref:Uncharacterized protein n=1 Tax=Amylocarpus encephaloides TaxID=45428 RepID=A0A9P8C0W5_9HELO|nr:hypothetical protein BJ875DRAFT_202380 [Amylocarpus encephaloides]